MSVTSLLVAFKTKIEEAVAMVPAMGAEDKLKAVQFWNVVSEKLQEIVNSSAADLNALALKIEKENADKLTLGSQHSHQPSNHYISATEFGAPNGFTDAVTAFVPPETLSPPRNQMPFLSQHSIMSMQRVQAQSSTEEAVNGQDNANLEDSNHNEIITCTPTLVGDGFGAADSGRECVADNSVSVSKGKSKKRQKTVKKPPPKPKTKQKVLQVLGNEAKGDESARLDGANNRLKTILVIENDSENADPNPDVPPDIRCFEELGCSDDEDNFDGDNNDFNDDDENEEVQKTNERLPPPKRGPNGTYICEYCNKELLSASTFTSHRWVHTKPYSCAECSARFSTRGNLVVHQRRHTGEKPFVCVECEARFSTNGNLKRHVKTHTGEKPWECPQCGHRFTEKKSLKVHMRRHTGEKPYECTICGKKFAQTGILQTHMALHLDQKTHLCDNCGKSFRQRSQLRLHMLRHEGVKKYPCSTCPAKFLTKGDLERHHRVHTGERPFVCELCGKTFTRQQSLNEHMNRHYGLKPYQCKYCLKQFAEMSACYKHIKQHERAKDIPLDDSSECNSMTQTDLMNLHLPSDSNGDIIEVSESFENNSEDHKYTVLVHAGEQPIEVTAAQHHDNSAGSILPTTDDPHITVTVEEHMVANFAAINLLPNAASFH